MAKDNEAPPPEVVAFRARHPAKAAEIKALMEGMAPIIHAHIVKTVTQACKPLQDRINQLEARPEMKYCGVWGSAKVYGSGNFVTDGGSLWHAQRANVGERPGAGDAWTLAVKKGRDAK